MKQRIRNLLLKNIFKLVIPTDIIRDIKGTLYLGSIKITEEELRSLKSEAKALESMRLWSILNETAKQKAFETGWTSSVSMDHLNTAKTMYHVLELQTSIINILNK